MAEVHVSILGLGRTGASVGLALARYNALPDAQNQFHLFGYDSRPGVRRHAKKSGAVPEVTGSLVRAVENQDLIVVALPYAETRPAFRDMAAGLREGAVVFDLSPLKLPSAAWAGQYFGAAVHLIGGTAVLNPALLWDGVDDVHHARADLFDDGQVLLAPTPSAAPDAVALAVQLSELIGASTHFVDPAEHDGLAATTEGLPAALGVAAFRAMASNNGWSEAQRLTNPNFGRLTHHLLDTHPDDLRDLLLNNRENVAAQLGHLLPLLQELQQVLEENDQDALEAMLVQADQRYRAWFGRRTSGKWEPDDLEDAPSAADSLLSGMLGGFLADKLKGKDKDND